MPTFGLLLARRLRPNWAVQVQTPVQGNRRDNIITRCQRGAEHANRQTAASVSGHYKLASISAGVNATKIQDQYITH